MTNIDPAIVEALYDLIAADRTGSYDGGDHHAHVNRITRRFAAAVDAARAEGYEQGAARVREAVEAVPDWLIRNGMAPQDAEFVRVNLSAALTEAARHDPSEMEDE